MSNNSEQPSNDPNVRVVRFKDTGDVYQFTLLSAREVSPIFLNFISIATPVLTASYEKFGEYHAEMEAIKKMEEEEGETGLQPEISLFDISVLFSQQLIKPEMLLVLEGLIIDLKKNGKDISLDDAFRGEFDKYLKLLEYAFKENLLGPLEKFLEERGLSGMLTSLRGLIVGAKETMKK